MPVSIAGSPVGSIFHGSTPITAVYEGAELLWSATAGRTEVDYGWESAHTEPYRILFMGSSSIAGYGVQPSEEFGNQLVAHIVSGELGVPATAPQKQTSGSVSAPTSPGFHFLNAAVGGTNSVTYWGDNRKSIVAGYNPDLIVHMVGSNDYSSGISPTTYRTNIERCISEANNRAPGCRHLLLQAFERLSTTSPTHPWADYGTALRQIAAARDDTDFCDIPGILGDRWTGQDLLLADNIHANWFGNTLIARAVAEYLNLDTHEGEVVYDWNLLGSNIADGTRLSSHAPTSQSLIQTPLISDGNNRPTVKNRSGVRSADYYNGAIKMSADWGGAYAAPMTALFVARMWNDGFGTNQKPVFTRRAIGDDGYMWLWRDTRANSVRAAMNSAISGGISVPRSVVDSPSVFAVTFLENGWVRIYPNTTVGTDVPPTGTIGSNGPWMKSLKMMTNTGENAWGEADMYAIRFIKGAGPEIVAQHVQELATAHNITLT